MFEIGESLAAARRAQRLELADVELLTCIRQRNLVALEAERFGLLPGHAYARAFLRTYASALGLDADRFVAEFDERYPETDEEPVLAFLPRRRRHPPVRAAAVLAALAAIGAFVAWSSTSQQGSLPKLAPPTTAAAAPVHRFRPAPVVTPPKPKPTNLVIHAARGNCWLLVRLGGASGRVLYEATLPAGHRITFGGAKLWIRFGAPANVDVRRGGRVVRGLAGAGDTPLNLVV